MKFVLGDGFGLGEGCGFGKADGCGFGFELSGFG